MGQRVDINADLGEGYGAYTFGMDEEMMPVITSANVACGAHAGDPVIMRDTVRRALQSDTAVGAHLGYPDLWGFGRRHVDLSAEQLYSFLVYQLGALQALAGSLGASLQHVKPHGALYNEAAGSADLSAVVCDAICDFDDNLVLFAPAGSTTVRVARDRRLRVAEEGFADRAYTAQGTLVPRDQPGAVIQDPGEVASRAVMLARGEIPTAEGGTLKLNIDTICLHGDTPGAVRIARRVRHELEESGIKVQTASSFLRSQHSG